MILAVLVKVAMKVLTQRTFEWDDAILSLAMAFGSAQSAMTSIQIFSGTGNSIESLPVSEVERYQKTAYSSELLYIVTLFISKISVLMLLRQITFRAIAPLHRRLVFILGSVLTMWSVASAISSAFQCRLPTVWMVLGEDCFDQFSFWMSYGVLNILTDAALIVLPIYAVWHVQLTVKERWIVVGCFALRTVVIGATIAQLIMLDHLNKAQDITLNAWSYQVVTQLVVSLSIITVCIPYMRSALMGFESGMFQTGDFHLKRVGGGRILGVDGIEDDSHHAAIRLNNSKPGHSTEGSHIYAGGSPSAVDAPYEQSTSATLATTPDEHWDSRSQSSQAWIIRTTRE
ncbi:MAG: hypothetical protein M1836_008177 [Candelina mexicana]|nr:MAG: hypothetical protein M1836_008177 [Candelina mexicana]